MTDFNWWTLAPIGFIVFIFALYLIKKSSKNKIAELSAKGEARNNQLMVANDLEYFSRTLKVLGSVQQVTPIVEAALGKKATPVSDGLWSVKQMLGEPVEVAVDLSREGALIRAVSAGAAPGDRVAPDASPYEEVLFRAAKAAKKAGVEVSDGPRQQPVPPTGSGRWTAQWA